MKKSQFKSILIIILILQSRLLFSAPVDVGKCLERYATMSGAVKKVLSVSGKLMGERGLSPRGEDDWVARQERLGELLAEQGLTHSDFIRVVDLFTELSLSEKVSPLGSSPRENLVDLSRLIQIPPEKVAPFYYVLREYFHTENPRALESSPEFQSEYQRRLFVAYRRAYEYKSISDNITRLSVPEMRELLHSRGHEVSESRIRALHVAFGLSRLERWRRPLTSEQRERVKTASQSAELHLTEGATPLSIAIRLWEAGRSFEEISEVLNAINPHKEKVFGAGALRDIFHARGPVKKGREWEPNEILELVNRYEDSTLQEIADELERTEPSVAAKAGHEGLTQPQQTTSVLDFTNPYGGVLESAKEVKINGVIQPEGLRRYLQKLVEENPQSLDPQNLGEVADRLGMSPSHLRLWAARLGVVTPGMNMPRHLVGRQVPVRGRGEVEPPPASSTFETDGFKAVSGGIERAHEAKLNEATKKSGQSEFLEGEANKEVRDYVTKLIENPEGGEAYFAWAKKNPGKFTDLHRKLTSDPKWSEKYEKAYEGWVTKELTSLLEKVEGPLFTAREVSRAAEIKGRPWSETSAEDKAILIKAYVLQKGQLPKQGNPGVEGKLATFLFGVIPKAGESEPRKNKEQYKDLLEWAGTNQENFQGIKLLHIALSPETNRAKAEVKSKNNQDLVEYAKSVKLNPEQSGMLSEVERMRLEDISKRNEELSPADKAILVKAYVLLEKQLPKNGAPGVEGKLASFISRSIPKTGASEAKTNKEQYKELLEWARANQDKFPGIKLLYTALSPETNRAKAEVKSKNNQDLVEYAKSVKLNPEQSRMLSEVEGMRLVALTKGDEALNPDDKALLIKAYVLQMGQLPKQGAPGAEGKLGDFLKSLTPRAGVSEPRKNKEQYKDLLEWAKANQEKFPGIKLLHIALSPETNRAKAEVKSKNNQNLVEYAKNVKLNPEQSGMLSEVERMRLIVLTKGDEALSPADKALLIKAYVLQKGQLPKHGAPGAEDKLAQFLNSSTPKAGASEPRQNKTQYQDLLKWAETYQNTSSAIKALYDRLRPKQD